MVEEIIVGETTQFHCLGSAASGMTWNFEKKLLPSNARTKDNYLIIENVTSNNEGSYICQGRTEENTYFVGRGLLLTMCKFIITCCGIKTGRGSFHLQYCYSEYHVEILVNIIENIHNNR